MRAHNGRTRAAGWWTGLRAGAGAVALGLMLAGPVAVCRAQAGAAGAAAKAEGGKSDAGKADGAKGKPDADKDALPLPEPSVTEHEVTIAGTVVRYRATASLLPLRDDALKTKARVFSVLYERLADERGADGQAVTLASRDPGARPITFAFNGGPGSSSVWLHLGALGPRRVLMAGPEGELPAQARLADNPGSWLDFTDLLFIDPVSTGYSRAAEGEDAKQFHGLEEDTRWVAEFIRAALVRHERWLSPKYLAGESYGTTRAASLSGYLQSQLGVYLNGITLVSTVLNFQTLRFDVGNDTPYWLYLPTYTATAWYHKKLPGPLQAGALAEALKASEAFARSDYLLALAQGDALPAAERERIAQRLSELTGLPKEFLLRANLRPTIGAFTKELLRDRDRTVGRLDSRYLGIDRDSAGERFEYDPSYATIQGPYTAALNDYVKRELKFTHERNYEILTGNVNPWSYAPNVNRYANVAETLRSAMSVNPHLRVHVAAGYYDLATPYFAALYTMNNLQLDESRRGNLSYSFYESGHMMYVREADLAKLRQEVARFYAGGR